MPLQGIDPVFLTTLPDVPAGYVGAVLGPLVAAVSYMWKYQERERERERADAKVVREESTALAREAWEAVREAATSSKEVGAVITTQAAIITELRERLDRIDAHLEKLARLSG